MEWDYLHLIKGYNINVVYHYPTFSMIVVNDVAYQVLESLKTGMPIPEAIDFYKHYNSNIPSFIQSVHKLLSNTTV